MLRMETDAAGAVGDFDADDGLAGDGRLDADGGGGEGEGNVVGEAGDFVDAHAGAGGFFFALKGDATVVEDEGALFVADGDLAQLDVPSGFDAVLGDGGAAIDLGDGGIDAEGGEGFDDDFGVAFGVLAGFGGEIGAKQVEGGQAPAVFAFAGFSVGR